MMLILAITSLLRLPSAVELITTHLGYPLYFLTFLGISKLLGVVALLIPGYPRIKEWAYAGFTFDLIGAVYSSIAVGDPASKWVFMLIFIALVAGSYIYYQKKLKESV